MCKLPRECPKWQGAKLSTTKWNKVPNKREQSSQYKRSRAYADFREQMLTKELSALQRETLTVRNHT